MNKNCDSACLTVAVVSSKYLLCLCICSMGHFLLAITLHQSSCTGVQLISEPARPVGEKMTLTVLAPVRMGWESVLRAHNSERNVLALSSNLLPFDKASCNLRVKSHRNPSEVIEDRETFDHSQ